MIYINNLERLDNESIQQYKLRLCRNKDELNLTWPEIGNLVSMTSGVSVSGDTIRKEFSSYERGFIDGVAEQINDEEVMAQLEAKKLELQKLKFKISDQRTQLNKSLRAESRFEDLKDLFKVEIAKLAKTKPLENPTVNINKSNKSALLVLSDWHRGIEADNNVNKINEEEFNKRVFNLLSDVITYGRFQNINDLHVALAGDLIHGLIHTSARVTSYERTIKQVMKVSEILAEFLSILAKHYNLNIYSVLDNHSRLIPNKSESVDEENLMAIIPWYLRSRLSGFNNITFVGECEDNVVVNVAGNQVLCMHGHYDKPESANDLAQMLGLIPDCIVLGHYHSPQSFEQQGIQVVVNGSLCGTDGYSYSIRKYSVPAQKLLIFEQGKQGILCEYNLRVADKRKAQ